MKAAIDLLRSVGIATIVASGNAGYTDSTSSPGCISSAISVGSVGYDDTSVWIAESSNRASWLSLYAPGVTIVSAGFGDQSDGSVADGGWTAKSGTSQAAPHVAGAWAVMREKAPSATVDDILTALQSTGIDVPDDANTFVKRRIQVSAAIEQIGVTGCAQTICDERLWLPMTIRQ
jgi:subtilisin family serine protease